jgi:hypothetical protein
MTDVDDNTIPIEIKLQKLKALLEIQKKNLQSMQFEVLGEGRRVANCKI